MHCSDSSVLQKAVLVYRVSNLRFAHLLDWNPFYIRYRIRHVANGARLVSALHHGLFRPLFLLDGLW